MRRFVLILGFLVAVTSAAALAPDIEPDRLIAHIRFLSSDEMKGRDNGSPELERAADYIAAQFKEAGLQPGGDPARPSGGRSDGASWFQSFQLQVGLIVGKDNRLAIEHDGRRVSLTLGTSYYPLAAPLNDTPDRPSAALEKIPLVFAGYGLAVPSIDYDDYAKVDVSNKAVLIFSHEPQERDPNSRFNGTRAMPQTTMSCHKRRFFR